MTDAREKTRLAVIGGTEALSGRPSSQRTRGQISRDRILDAALAILREDGLEGMTISAVCGRAAVTPPSLYHHFGDKAGLMAAMIEESMARSSRRYLQLIPTSGTTLQKINAFIEATWIIAREPENDAIAVLSELQQSRSDGQLRRAIASARERAWRFMAAEFGAEIDVRDPMLICHIQFAFISYTISVRQSSEDLVDARALMRSYQRTFIIALAADNPRLLEDAEFKAAFEEASRPSVAYTDHEQG